MADGARGRDVRSSRRQQPGPADRRRCRSEGHHRRNLRRDAHSIWRVRGGDGTLNKELGIRNSEWELGIGNWNELMADEPLIEVSHLTTVFDTRRGPVPAVDDVSFEIRRGETLGLVGESGSGKSVTALSILRLVQPPGRTSAGRIAFNGRDLLALSEREMQAVRGAEIALIFQ